MGDHQKQKMLDSTASESQAGTVALAAEARTRSEPDWKAIAQALAQRVDFAMRLLKAQGSGMVGTFDDEAEDVPLQHWREYFADALEMIPGVRVDREMIHTFDLPAKERRRRQAAIKAARTEHFATKRNEKAATPR